MALAVWNMYVIVGLAWQAGWSTSLCVSTKIYFQIGLLCFLIFCNSEYTSHKNLFYPCIFLFYTVLLHVKSQSFLQTLLSNYNSWLLFQKNTY